MRTVRNILIAMAAVVALAGANPALAVSEIDIDFLGTADFDNFGYVGAGESLNYQHMFDPINDPTKDITSVDSAWLFVGITDDWQCDGWQSCVSDWFVETETAALDLNGVAWESGQATARIFWGDVTAEANLLVNGGILNVTVSSSAGDFNVLWSKMLTEYQWVATGGGGTGPGSGVNAIPEPSAALVFAFGALIVTGSVRRHRS